MHQALALAASEFPFRFLQSCATNQSITVEEPTKSLRHVRGVVLPEVDVKEPALLPGHFSGWQVEPPD